MRIRIDAMGQTKSEYFINDYLGSPVVVADAVTNTVNYQQYQDPFGNVEMQQGQPAANPEFKYTDKEYEEDLDAYYFQARYYDPVAGRFWGRDQVKLEDKLKNYFLTNNYAFVNNNPVNYVDLDGKRTYFGNGIGNNGGTVPDYIQKTVDYFKNNGTVEDPRALLVHRNAWPGGNFVDLKGAANTFSEMIGKQVYSDEIVSRVLSDLKKQPLEPGEQLNIVAFSGAGQPSIEAIEKLANYDVHFDNLVLIGAPVFEFKVDNVKNITQIVGAYDGIKVWLPLHNPDKSNFIFMRNTTHINDMGYFGSQRVDQTRSLIDGVVN
jgi:RHS repeat-associated protein